MSRFDAAPFIKDIGRGSQHPTDLSYERAEQLWLAVLEQRLDPIALGGVLIALRVKGETATEIAAFLAACQRCGTDLGASAAWPRPVLIPSYNGARKMPNLTPLLAMLLARRGVPVLVHGGSGDDIPAGRPQRVTSAALFAAMGFAAVEPDGLSARWEALEPAFMSIEALNAPLSKVLSMRAILGVRNSSHTLVKLLQPLRQPAVCLSSYTHPEYLVMLSELLGRDDVLERQVSMVLRATEGEAVANARRALTMQQFTQRGQGAIEPQAVPFDPVAELPLDCSVGATVTYIEDVVSGRLPVPTPIAWQVDRIAALRDASIESDRAAL